MGKERYLKDKNNWIIIIFILWCLSIYAVSLAGINSFWDELQNKYAQFSKKDGIIMTIMPILLVIFCNILSSPAKAKIVFWKIKNALPGTRAFTVLAPQDPRIDMDILKKKLGDIPKEPTKQNALWYSLYKKMNNKLIVKKAHKIFLLTRDISSISLVFAIVGTIGLVYFNAEKIVVFKYFLFMLMQYVIFAIVSQNNGNRFVCNVLAEYVTN